MFHWSTGLVTEVPSQQEVVVPMSPQQSAGRSRHRILPIRKVHLSQRKETMETITHILRQQAYRPPLHLVGKARPRAPTMKQRDKETIFRTIGSEEMILVSGDLNDLLTSAAFLLNNQIRGTIAHSSGRSLNDIFPPSIPPYINVWFAVCNSGIRHANPVCAV